MFQSFDELIDAAMAGPKKTIAVAGAADDRVMRMVTEIKNRDLCRVILVDSEEKIRCLAEKTNTSLDGIAVVGEEDPQKVPVTAVSLVSGGQADVFVKGNLNTSDFLRAVLNRDVGLRTGRRLSALTCYEVPGMKKLFFITDGGMNVAPDLPAKADILRNAVEVLHTFGLEKPKVALLSANEKVNPEMRSSVDAWDLCQMARRGELPEAVYEGPIAFDVAMRPDAAEAKGIDSKISGDVDLFLVPNIETGNCLGKAIGYFANGQAAVLMVGASRPVVMTSRAASVKGKLTAVAFALLASEKTDGRKLV